MGLRDLFAVKPAPMLHVATTRQCNMQQMRPGSATAHATRAQQNDENRCVPTFSDATPDAARMQYPVDSDVARSQFSGSGRQAVATSEGDPPDTEPAQDLPLMAACEEFDALIDRLCAVSKHPPEVREEMRRVQYRMAPCNVPRELEVVRDLVKMAESRTANHPPAK